MISELHSNNTIKHKNTYDNGQLMTDCAWEMVYHMEVWLSEKQSDDVCMSIQFNSIQFHSMECVASYIHLHTWELAGFMDGIARATRIVDGANVEV